MKTYKLTAAQGNILDMQRFYPDTAIGNQGMAVIYHEQRDPDLLEQAIIQMIKMHEGLRMRMTANEMQYISDEIPDHIERLHFNSRAELDKFADKVSKQPFTAQDTAQCVFYLFDLNGKQGIYACLSHMICDATTQAVCILTIEQCYETLKSGISSSLPAVPRYTEFIRSDEEYLVSEQFKKDKAFWHDFYRKSPCSSRINAAEPSSPAAKRLERRLSSAAEKALQTLVNEWKVTPAVVFETIMTVYLHRLNTDHTDVTVAVPILNRKGLNEKRTAGMRVLTLPLTVPAASESTLFEWAQTVRQQKNKILRHHKYPLPLIQEHLRSLGTKGRLYHVMVNYHSAKAPQIFDTLMYSSGANESALCLHIDDRYGVQEHMFTLDYQTEAFPDEAEIEFLAKRIEHMLCQSAVDPDLKVSEIEIVSPEEKALLDSFNDTAVNIPDCCVHTMFVRTAEKYPDREAVIFRGKSTTYHELERQSAAAAAFLYGKLTPGEIVPVIAERSEVMIAVMLGILRVGCAFMLVDPNYPAVRISQMIADAHSSIALTDGRETGLDISCINIKEIDFDNVPTAFANMGTPDDICYVVFTSGSTGQPKGIGISHKSTMNYIMPDKRNMLGKCFPLDTSRIMSITNPIFDIFITETLLPLVNGMTVIMADEQESSDPKLTAELMLRYKPEVLQTTPTRLKLLLNRPEGLRAIAPLRSIMLGGERFPIELLDVIRTNSAASVMNVYGPSETTVWCTADDVTDGDITIGLPVSNQQITVLDEKRRLMPVGTAGEICIDGAGLSEGYLSRPELTQKQFVQSPFGGKMYRSGDMAYRRCDGKLVFLGRRDGQVKLRGQRIELGEIEAAMAGFESIELAAVAVNDIEGRQILCGYYTAEVTIDEEQLRKQMRCRLPVHMIPQLFMHLTKMPMTASGKTDRKALPAIVPEKNSEEYSAPMTETEKKVAEIWENELHTSGISREDDIFRIGADSLGAISFVSNAAEEWGITLKVSDVFAHPQIKELAALIDKQFGHGTNDSVFPVAGKDKYKLLPQQAAHYRFWKSDRDSFAYHIGYRLSLTEKTDRERLKRAIIDVIRAEKVFNCRIEESCGEPYAVYEPDTSVSFDSFTDESDFRKPFDLEKSPLVHLGETENCLLIDLHHIIVDGASVELLFERFAAAYINNELTSAKIWLGDYASFFETLDHSEAYRWFRSRFSGDFQPIKLPETDTGLTGGKFIRFPVPDELYFQMKESVKKYRTTMTAFTLAAFAKTYSPEIGGVKDIFTMMSFRNRRRETEKMIGMLSTSQPVRVTVIDDKERYIKSVTEMLTEQYEFQELPMDMLAENVDLSGLPQIDTSFIYQPEQQSELPAGLPVPEQLETMGAIMHLGVHIMPEGEHCSVGIVYKRDKYIKDYIERFAERYISELYQLTSEHEK